MAGPHAQHLKQGRLYTLGQRSVSCWRVVTAFISREEPVICRYFTKAGYQILVLDIIPLEQLYPRGEIVTRGWEVGIAWKIHKKRLGPILPHGLCKGAKKCSIHQEHGCVRDLYPLLVPQRVECGHEPEQEGAGHNLPRLDDPIVWADRPVRA